jgi:hypothetical protein
MPSLAHEGRTTIAMAIGANALMNDRQIYLHLGHEIVVYFTFFYSPLLLIK